MRVYCITCPKCKWKMHTLASSSYPIKTGYRAPKCEMCDFQTRECDRKLSDEPKFHQHFAQLVLHALTTMGEFYDDC